MLPVLCIKQQPPPSVSYFEVVCGGLTKSYRLALLTLCCPARLELAVLLHQPPEYLGRSAPLGLAVRFIHSLQRTQLWLC